VTPVALEIAVAGVAAALPSSEGRRMTISITVQFTLSTPLLKQPSNSAAAATTPNDTILCYRGERGRE